MSTEILGNYFYSSQHWEKSEIIYLDFGGIYSFNNAAFPNNSAMLFCSL